jgi:hypothetical protein
MMKISSFGSHELPLGIRMFAMDDLSFVGQGSLKKINSFSS